LQFASWQQAVLSCFAAMAAAAATLILFFLFLKKI